MDKAGSKNALITAALIVAGIRLWLQVRGKTKTPFNEWAIGWGATFFFLAILSEVSPTSAGSLSLLIAISDFLANAVNLTTDIESLIKNAPGSGPSNVLVQQPFANTAQAQTTAPPSGKVGS